LLGLQPLAHLHRLTISPNLPASWPYVRLKALTVGAHTLTVHISPAGLEVQHLSGPEPLDLRYQLPAGGAALEHTITYGQPPQLLDDEQGRWLQALLAPGQRLSVNVSAERILVHAPDRREEPSGNGTEVIDPASQVPSAR
jgi:hypothetical protein